jgi:hypothetical protein
MMRSSSLAGTETVGHSADGPKLPQVAYLDQTGVRDSVVPRYLVHRTALSEVFLASAHEMDRDIFAVDGQWPRRHFYYDVNTGRVDPVLVAETLRQATIFVAHSFYDVPLQQRFLMDGIRFDLLATHVAPSLTSQDIRMVVRVDGVRRNASGVAALRTHVEFFADGTAFARGQGDLQLVSPRVYDRMRSNHSMSPQFAPAGSRVSGLAFARGAEIIPVNGSTEQQTSSWTTNIDASHPVFFDHPVDHLPGMLVLELMRQVARSATGCVDCEIVSFNGQFSRFVELDKIVRLELGEVTQMSDEAWSLSVTVVQSEIHAVAATLVVLRQSVVIDKSSRIA